MMQHTLETFEQQKRHADTLLVELADFLEEGRELGVELPAAWPQQLAQSRDALAQTRLRIVLVGGFSEGKTALAAAWLERLEPGLMAISQRESSDIIQRYELDERIELVDTPGLFGFKQRFNPDTHAMEAYRDITRQYVSAAHLVLYVMNPANPIKPSHAEELRWLFRTLGLLPRTVFVLGRFDEVADLEDDQDYREKLELKRASIIAHLDDMLQLSATERETLTVVAVSANPFNLGTAHWLANLADFRALSRIGLLQTATQTKIAVSGGPLTLAAAMRQSLLSDLIGRQLPLVQAGVTRLREESTSLAAMQHAQQTEIGRIQTRIAQARQRLGERITRHFEDLMLQARGTTPETFQAFYHHEIGADAALLRQRIKAYFLQEVSHITKDLDLIRIRVSTSVEAYNSNIASVGKQGLQYLANSNLINTQNLLAARDSIGAIAKTLGLDAGQYLLFRSLSAANLAKGLNGLLSVLGLALEVWETWQQAQRERAFREAVTQLCEQMAEESQQLLQRLEGPDFEAQFFPGLAPLQAQLCEVSQALAALRERLNRFERWRARGLALQAGVPATETTSAHQNCALPAAASDKVVAKHSPDTTVPSAAEIRPFWRRWLP